MLVTRAQNANILSDQRDAIVLHRRHNFLIIFGQVQFDSNSQVRFIRVSVEN
jgi:hypothetical protein